MARIKKMESGGKSSLGMKSVKAGYDSNPGVTRADIIVAAKKEAKGGVKLKKSQAGSKVALRTAQLKRIGRLSAKNPDKAEQVGSKMVERATRRQRGKEYIQKTLNCQIYFKFGNHDERYQHYLWQKLGELNGVEDFELENLIKKRVTGIKFITDKRIIKANDLNIVHGHEFASSIISPVNIARGLYLRSRRILKTQCLKQSVVNTKI